MLVHRCYCSDVHPDQLKALSEPTRLAVVMRLACSEAPMTVTEVSGCCGVHLSGVSRHLAALRAAGLVRVERIGREAHYQLERAKLCESLRGFADALEKQSESPEECCE